MRGGDGPATEATAVVIGSGAFGSSIAYHLAALGRQGVVLVDAHEIASQTSPRAAGLTKQLRADPELTRLAILSVQKITRFPEETGEPLTFFQSGSVNTARTEREEAVIRAEIAAGRELGLEIHEISADKMVLLAPFLRARDIRVISYAPSDLYLEDPGQLPRGYAHAAGRLGVTVLSNTRVTEIAIKDGRVVKLCTERGEILTPVIVDAAGAWTRLLAEQIGVRIPIVPVLHQLYITGPVPGIEVHQPICRIYDACVYMRPHQGGLLLGGYEPNPQFYDMRTLPADFQIRDLSLEIGVLRNLAALVRDQITVGREIPIREHRGGLPTMTADGLPIIGPVPGVEGFFVASGCCVGGLSLSPAVGQLLAELIHEGSTSISLERFAISRFGSEFADEERLREACRKQYSEWYAAIPQVQHPQAG